MLLLQEFDIEFRDRSGVENMVAHHLSRIKEPVDSLPIRDNFPDEHLMQLHSSHVTPWFFDYYIIFLPLFDFQRGYGTTERSEFILTEVNG